MAQTILLEENVLENKSSTIVCNALAYIRENKIPAKDYFTDDYLQELATNDMYTLVVLLSVVPNLPLAEKYCKVVCDYYADKGVTGYLPSRLGRIILMNINNIHIHHFICDFLNSHVTSNKDHQLIAFNYIKVYAFSIYYHMDLQIDIQQPYFDDYANILINNILLIKRIEQKDFKQYKTIWDIINHPNMYSLDQHPTVKENLCRLHRFLLHNIDTTHYLYKDLMNIDDIYRRTICD